MIDIREKGADELSAKLKRMGEGFDTFMDQTMTKAVLYVHSQVPPYPPEPPASTYTRRLLLGKSITTEVRGIGAETVGVIGTNISYAPWVISEDQQAWMHVGRWWTLHQVARNAEPAVQAFFTREIDKYINR